MPNFHETVYGKRFFESQLPKLIKTLERIADALEEQNKRERRRKENTELFKQALNEAWDNKIEKVIKGESDNENRG